MNAVRLLLRISALILTLATVSAACGSPSEPDPIATPTVETTTALPATQVSSDTPVPTNTEAPPPTPTVTHTSQPSVAPTRKAAQPTHTPTITSTPPPTLERTLSLQSPMMTGDDVLALQQQLFALGYTEVGKPDGVFGQMTDVAVRRFQEEYELVVDGIVGPQTWEVLFSQSVTVADTEESGESSIYSIGSFAPEVREIEKRLLELGYPLCETNNEFSEQTAFAVKQFQAANSLEADGVVGGKTWEVLFSEDAVPATQPERRVSFSEIKKIGKASDLSYDGKFIWVVNYGSGGHDDAVSKLNASTGEVVKRIEMADLGEVKGSDGKTYPIHMKPTHILAGKKTIWVAGLAAPSTAQGSAAVLPMKPTGKPLGEPVYLGPLQLGKVEALFSDGRDTWALVNESSVRLYQLDAAKVNVKHKVSLNLENASDAVFDGTYLWVAAEPRRDKAVWRVNLENGAVGPVLGACGNKLAFDGKWIWVTSENGRAVAVDPQTLEIVAYSDLDGSPKAITSNGKNALWLLLNKNTKTYLQTARAK